jgi:hypothetical protein
MTSLFSARLLNDLTPDTHTMLAHAKLSQSITVYELVKVIERD